MSLSLASGLAPTDGGGHNDIISKTNVRLYRHKAVPERGACRTPLPPPLQASPWQQAKLPELAWLAGSDAFAGLHS